MATITRTNLRGAVAQIAARRGFNANGTLTGGYFNTSTGRLPQDRVTGFNRATDADDFYAVYSYGTPIAWYAHGTWTVPAVKYSVTTSRHQSTVTRAVLV